MDCATAKAEEFCVWIVLALWGAWGAFCKAPCASNLLKILKNCHFWICDENQKVAIFSVILTFKGAGNPPETPQVVGMTVS